jgi:hypothetical protein
MSYLRCLCLFACRGVFDVYPQARIVLQRKESYEQIYIKGFVVNKCPEGMTFELHFLIVVDYLLLKS